MFYLVTAIQEAHRAYYRPRLQTPGLTETERYVIRRYFVDEDRPLLREIAAELHISVGWCGQLKLSGQRKIRKAEQQ